ncbi:hypothetical protein ADIARSV_0530 [Arcticibacter svalbardensis MN12-7]|uniref:Outer membrane protein n=1 Tax=Arcticibacter svalbardensis MN12-7 TaxID=1150600 RepID=R9GXR7_9SPHI|nr:RagB/SusD family nutrient uptake outer membrane protein [Arcticibacter svalbardensis]EOR96295.1 hypothetical protein ADIARSV_0530 [Arcticibacter svalbardensis MN12-7]
MKELKYLLVSLLLILVTSSCKKGWLDVTASNQIKAEDQFKQTSGFRDALMGVYIGMTNPELYSRDMTWNMVDLLSQQYNPLTGLARYDQVQQFNYRSIEAVDKVDALWNREYNVIASTNAALEHLDKSEGVLNTIDHAIIKGELLGLRAFLHFDLIRLYGHSDYAKRPELKSKLTIPYILKFSKDLTPQLSYEETFALMEKDIQEALDLLKEDPIYNNPQRPADYYAEVNRNGFYNDRSFRMNYYAVKALQARVLSWQGGAKTAAAAIAAEEVIAGSPAKLITPGDNVSTDRILSKEHLFSLDVNGFADIVNPFLNAELTTNYDALFIPNSSAQEMYEAGNPNIGLADVRYTTLLSSQARGMVSIKLLQPAQNTTFNNIMPLMKLPEMYYIAAESYLSTNLEQAINYINKVRESRGIVENIPADADVAKVEEELFNEYRKEYVSEGQLFFFYKRIGRQHIPGLSAETAGDNIYMIPYPNSEVEFGNRVQ